MKLAHILAVLGAFLFILTFQPIVFGQNVTVSSSITYNPSTQKVSGVSQTTMDYYTAWYYRLRTKGSIYTQNPASPLHSLQLEGTAGQMTVTVLTQANTTPNTTYNLRTEHAVLPTTVQYGMYYDYWMYYYYAYGPNYQFGANQTVYGCQYTNSCYAPIVYTWIVLGNTNHSVARPPDLAITNARVSGNLGHTTQNALLGAPVILTAQTTPNIGSFSWSFTGSPEITGTTTGPSVTVRWTQQSTWRATVTVTYPGGTRTEYVDVNNRLPTITSFTAEKSSDAVNLHEQCSGLLGTTYSLGCYNGTFETGIGWTATVDAPAVPYLSDPGDSGIKFVQAVSALRKRLRNGTIECVTKRNPENDVESGWQLDTNDPYNHPAHPPRYFDEGNQLVMSDWDSPASGINNTFVDTYASDDVHHVSDSFEIYVFYFVGNPSSPIFQRALPLQGSGQPYGRLAWDWGGTLNFDYSKYASYNLVSQTTSGTTIQGSGTSVLKPINTNVAPSTFQPCAGTTASTNMIDSSKFFTRQLYLDFLNREPDESGWNFWRSNMTGCGFDMNCVKVKRVDVARAFFYSGEFIGLHPELGGTRGTHQYNEAFVYWCYRAFLRREPNAAPDNNWNGYNFWVGVLDSTNPDAGDYKYNQMLKAFIESGEYRGRF